MEGEKGMAILDIQALIEAAKTWAESAEGQKAIADTQECVQKVTAFLSAERIVDGNMLRMPHGI